ncbi:MAG: sensor histidine kinase [Gammaproteobacteria bacterium]
MLWRTHKSVDLEGLRAENTRLFADLAAMQARFQRITLRMWEIQEDERRRLARELHDELGQVLTTLLHRLDQPGEEARLAAVGLARGALEDVRELSRLLRPPVLDDLGLGPALHWLGRRTREQTGIDVVVVAQALDALPQAIETLFFRIAQEAVTNAVKHATPSRVELRLNRIGDRVELRVRDDGVGFDPSTIERGIGLSGMQDRVTSFDGSLAVVSTPGRGTTVTAVL